ncbi:MAG: hypothetical protein LUC31_01375 [Coprobacillus sp.]|nr:hypothetical protein [Coprobacillus sp.]
MKVVLCFLPLCLLLTSCTPNPTNTPTERTYQYYDVSDKHIEYTDIFTLEGDFYLYIYNQECCHCRSIKQDVIRYSLDKDDFYFLEYVDDIPFSYEDVIYTIGAASLDEFWVTVTPTMYYFSDHVVVEVYEGTSAILDKLEI